MTTSASPDNSTSNKLLAIAEAFQENENLNNVSKLQIELMKAWAEADPKSNISLHPASYVENFRDMAKAALTHLGIEWVDYHRGSSSSSK